MPLPEHTCKESKLLLLCSTLLLQWTGIIKLGAKVVW
jgi:hypothetical protein